MKDCNFHLVHLQVDGGMTASPLLLQLQADLVGLDVLRPTMAESSALVLHVSFSVIDAWNQILKKRFCFFPISGCCNGCWTSRWQMGH